VISRATKTDHSFNRLLRIENSKYFLAEGHSPSNISELFLLSVEKGQVEIIQAISGMVEPVGSFVMISNESLMIHHNRSVLCLEKCTIHRKDKTLTKIKREEGLGENIH